MNSPVRESPDISHIFQLPVPQHAGHISLWAQLYGSAFGLSISQALTQNDAPVLVVANDTNSCYRLKHEIEFYSHRASTVEVFPDWETLPYDTFSPHEDIVSKRLELLNLIGSLKSGVIIVSIATLMQRLPPPEFIRAHSLQVRSGQRIDIDEFRIQLDHAGYQRVSEVMEHGEYAIRGSLIDLFPMGCNTPFRIDLFDDEIESIRVFDPDSQRTISKTDTIHLMPGREFSLSEEAITRFRARYRKRFEGDPNKSVIYRDVSEGLAPGGIEYYLPMFYDSLANLFDYFPKQTLVIQTDLLDKSIAQFQAQVAERFEQRRHDTSRPILEPHEVFIDEDEYRDNLTHFRSVVLQRFEQLDSNATVENFNNCGTSAPPSILIQIKAEHPVAPLQSHLKTYSGRTLLVAESTGRREYILELLRPYKLVPVLVKSWKEFLLAQDRLCITVADIDQGLQLESPEVCIVTEPQLFGTRAHRQYKRKRLQKDQEHVIQNLTDLVPGAPVVHIEHGIGRYRGLETMEINQQQVEFLTLEYANEDKLYVPVSSLHLISRYTGASAENAPLHRLGSDQWERVKKRASKRINDIAVTLLDIYARRAAEKGHAYQFSKQDYQNFVAAFPFEETPDQEQAIAQVLDDMRSERPMDRVICGDVGFGKTEVAMRATFIAVSDNQQVAVMVPTTLLAQQHYQNFADRFADWPVRVDVLSRFRSNKETQAILNDLAQGKIDIIIGTHKLIQKDIKFKNLGLLVLDEEHRFGVQHKERLKSLRSKVDILTMTATPIPRTLNMALSGLRDLSIIATPPTERVAIKTFVMQWNDTTLREALLREIKRGGQVYFLHNDVATIERTRDTIKKLLPEAEVQIAHGQMRERELEQVMLDFYHQRFNILVCTTIIESGIDIPSANTIIINRADKLGLAQLHQLRGRVGRSHHRAYAYLLVPHEKAMTTDALKRLEAIESLEALGSGFMLASHDLEIRGAGELLGDEQSGQIQEIGFSLYMELLERAVNALRQGETPDLDQPLDTGPEVDLSVPALIDESYLPDIHTRLIMYKRIANAKDQDALRDLQVEMIDRFGLLTDFVKNLFMVTEIKLKAISLGIKKITAHGKGAKIVFGSKPAINVEQLIRMIQQQPQIYRMEGQEILRIIKELKDPSERFTLLEQTLDSIIPA